MTSGMKIPEIFFIDAFWIGVATTLVLIAIIWIGVVITCVFWEARDRSASNKENTF